MKKPTIRFKSRGGRSALDELSEIGISKAEAERMICDAVERAERMARRGLRDFDKIMGERRRKRKKRAWQRNTLVKRYFGSRKVTIPQIRKTRRRLNRAHRRLSKRRLTIRVFPQPPGSESRAQNLGTVFSPRRFKLFPEWFKLNNGTSEHKNSFSAVSGDEQRAAIIIHELNHDLFFDQKLNGTPVYGETLAIDLASQKPRKARRSSENFEWFCIRRSQS